MNTNPNPKWPRNRDQLFLWAFTAMFALMLGLVPTKLEAMRQEHLKLLVAQQVTCYNTAELVRDEALRKRQMRRCLELELDKDDAAPSHP